MMSLTLAVILLVQVMLALPFLVEVLAGLPGRRTSGATPLSIPMPRTAILMPAHDEGRHISATLAALRPVLPPAMRLLVIADNCSDDTARRAREAGAEVVERYDPAQRGKGHALAFGREWLHEYPPEVVIVLDADCRVDPGALERLAIRAGRGVAVQGLYLMAPVRSAPPMVQVSGFAFLVKNLVRQRGLSRIGAPVPLGGTGMAFPWHLFRDAPLGGGHLTEDLALAVALARAGHPPRFESAAVVWSDPAGLDATLVQRARWEGGFLQVARDHGFRLVADGVRRRRAGLLWLGLHVLTPPLTGLMGLEVALAVAASTVGLVIGQVGAAAGSVGVLLVLSAAVLAAWAGHGRPWLSPGALVRLPLYLAWKLPGYLRLVRGRGPSDWVRTERGS